MTDFGAKASSDKLRRRVGLAPVTNGPPAYARVPLWGDFRARGSAAKCRPSTVAGNSHPKIPLFRINRLRVNPHPSEANRAVPRASSILRGTEGSNLLPSSRESDANLTFGGRRVELEGGNLGGGQKPVIIGCRPGRRTRKCFDIAPTGGDISAARAGSRLHVRAAIQAESGGVPDIVSKTQMMPLRFSVTSRYASSSDKGSMIGVYWAKTSRIWREIAL